MRKAIATFGIGPHQKMLALAMPTFIEYAGRHNYEIVVGTGESAGRPPYWGKVLLLQRVLRVYDFVLWLDADVVILDGSVDMASIVPETAFQALALVLEDPPDPYPCNGVWALRNSEMSHRFLSEVWGQEDLIDHKFPEQAAALRTLGWSLVSPWRKVNQTQWDEATYYLPEEWDMLPVYPIGYARGFIRHYAEMPYAVRLIEMRTDLARIAASRNTGLAKVPPLLRYQLGRVGRAVEIQKPLEKVRHLKDDPRGVLQRRLGR